MFITYKTIKEPMSRIYKELLKTNKKKANDPVKNGQNTYTGTLQRKKSKWPINI